MRELERVQTIDEAGGGGGKQRCACPRSSGQIQPHPCHEVEIDNVETSTAKTENSTADNSDMSTRAMDVEERSTREVARRVDRERRALIENHSL